MRGVGFLTFAILAAPLSAASPGEKPKDMREMIGDSVMQPLADVNIRRREIPPELIAIRDDPYATTGIRTCNQIISEVRKMDSALGKDFDQIALEGRAQKRKETAIGAAGSVITSFIPFRGVIREVSGANKADQLYREAIFAGAVRRAYLKGLGQQRRCRAPGRPYSDLESAQDAAAEMMRSNLIRQR